MNFKKYLVLFLLVLSSSFLTGQIEFQSLIAMDADTSDQFGTAVAISGDFAIVGAWLEDDDETGNDSLDNAGSVYIFERNNLGDWIEVQKIVASDRAEKDEFGKSVAIDGNYLVVGSPKHDIDATNQDDAGAAYVFERNSLGVWEEKNKLVSDDQAEDDYFGSSVSISRNYIVIGSPFDDQDASDSDTKPGSGSAYIFEKNPIANWTQLQKIVAMDRDTADLFGIDVSIYDSTILVGAHKDDIDLTQIDAGAAYIFQQDISGTWNEEQKLIASDRNTEDFFGFSVAIYNDKAVVGAHQEDEDENDNNTLTESGSAYVFEKSSTGTWSESKKLLATDRDANDFFGYDVSISGNQILIGAPLEDQDALGGGFKTNSGSGYVFEKENGSWSQLQKIAASDRNFFHFFGTSVAISEDFLTVGAPFFDMDPSADDDAGGAYLFQAECYSELVIDLDSVPARIFSADSSIITLNEVNIKNGMTTVFQAGNRIVLTQGFTAFAGSVFEAKIVECSTLPFSSPSNSSNVFLENLSVDKAEAKDISNLESNFNLSVSPNPNSGIMDIQFYISDDENFKVDLFHASGKLMKQIFIGNEKGNYSINFQDLNLASGIYFLQLSTDSKVEIEKIIISK